MRPIGIDLFAGVGGFSLGFEQAGFDVVAAVEIDPVHAAVHSYNFPACKTIVQSVIGLSGDYITRRASIDRVDVVFGGPPCQGFSMMGKRALDDPRNALVLQFARLVTELDASYFVFENVKGLTLGGHQRFLEEIVEDFKRRGYEVRLPWMVLNASDYGVPQNRERLFLLGAKKGLKLPDYPIPLGDCPTCFDALHDIPDAELFPELIDSDEVVTGDLGLSSKYSRKMRCPDGFGYIRHWNPQLLTSSMRTHHTEESRRRFANTPQGRIEPISRFFKLPVDGVSNTLRAGTDSARGAFTSPRPIHYQYPRCVTVREMARLHSYPDWFRFHATKWHGARQIGNSVPPFLARAVAESIMAALGKPPTCSDHTIELGDSKLLRMDMTEAARYWGIAVPIAQRFRSP